MKQWQAVNIDNCKYLGVVEIETGNAEDEISVFEIVQTEDHLVFGGFL